MSLYSAWPIDPSSACVTAINTLISELSGPRKCLEKRPFSCSITLRALSPCPTLVLAELSVSSGSVSRHTRDFWTKQEHDFTFVGESEKRTMFTPILRLIVMESLVIPRVKECPSRMHSHTNTYLHKLLLTCMVHTYKHACIVDVLVQTLTLADCGINLHTVIHMWSTHTNTHATNICTVFIAEILYLE